MKENNDEIGNGRLEYQQVCLMYLLGDKTTLKTSVS